MFAHDKHLTWLIADKCQGEMCFEPETVQNGVMYFCFSAAVVKPKVFSECAKKTTKKQTKHTHTRVAFKSLRDARLQRQCSSALNRSGCSERQTSLFRVKKHKDTCCTDR